MQAESPWSFYSELPIPSLLQFASDSCGFPAPALVLVAVSTHESPYLGGSYLPSELLSLMDTRRVVYFSVWIALIVRLEW